jgi:isoleucyl-tRNA synthetase
MEYNFSQIEKTAQEKWQKKNVYKVNNDTAKPKYYVLDMFPYPSGAGLHVGHPLGYIFSDIISRYKRMQGFNVLHPMGFDAFGLPAEQYAIQTGQHPEITTKQNLETYRNNCEKLAFATIGHEKFLLANLNITNGHNGFFLNYIILFIVIKIKVRIILLYLSNILKNTEITTTQPIPM